MVENRANNIAEKLQNLVFSGDYADGVRLDESSLAEKFGVSRTPSREAFKILSTFGIVRQIPNRGYLLLNPGQFS